MNFDCFTDQEKISNAIPITIVSTDQFSSWLEQQSEHIKNWAYSHNFVGQPETVKIFPNTDGSIASVVVCLLQFSNPWFFASLAGGLPAGTYRIASNHSLELLQQFALVWALHSYQFNRYKTNLRSESIPRLLLTNEYQPNELKNLIEAIYLVRDLINTPTEDMGPEELSGAAKELANSHGAKFKEIVGEELLRENFPSIYHVGKASHRQPRLIDLQWGNPKHPKVTLVGKGVCFDTGGLDLKPSKGMRFMKKDMGGAAHVLGLGHLIMSAKLPIRLRILIPAVENAVSSNAYRPGDILKTRKGIYVEIGNTDAEGRVILSDALWEAVSEKPSLIIDFATLTGAARVALGTEIPALFSNNEEFVNKLLDSSKKMADPLWHMPLYSPYRSLLASSIADINNVGDDSYGGAIIAALFLNEFVTQEIPWAHIDLMAWNLRSRPGKPEGGEAMGLQAVFHYLRNAFPSNK